MKAIPEQLAARNSTVDAMRHLIVAAIARVAALVAFGPLACCGWLGSAPVEPPDAISVPDLPPPEPTLVISLASIIGLPLGSIFSSHSLASTPCPQLLGYLRADNETSEPAELNLSIAPPDGIRLGISGPLEVAPGQSEEIRIEYDCSVDEPIEAKLTATFTSGFVLESRTFSVAVALTDVPVGHCDNVVDVSAIVTSKSPLSALATAASATCAAAGRPPAADWADCTKTALASKAHISTACASCYVDAMTCWEARCSGACKQYPGDCAKCATDEGCLDAFYACSALDPVGVCAGAPCDVQSATGCAGHELVTYQGPGVCYDSLGSPACQFPTATISSCEPGFPCVDGVCPADPTDYVFAPTAAYVTTASVAPDWIGADLDGDGKADNELASWFSLLGNFFEQDLNELIQAYISAGELVVLVEFPNLSDLSTSPAQSVNALAGRALDSSSQGNAGLGTFEVDLDRSFSPSTGRPAFSLAGSIVDGELSADAGSGTTRFEASGSLTLGPNGVGPDIQTGLVSGSVSVAALAALLDEGSADCGCLGLSPGVPRIVVVTSDPAKLKLGCSPAYVHALPSCVEGVDAPHCVALARERSFICPGLGALPLDQDVDGNGQRDALSFALNFSAVSATIVGSY